MRYPPSEKLEIIRLVELSHLPARRTLAQLGIPRTSFYRWYDRYLTGGPEALEDRRSRPGRVWNRIPDEVRGQIVQLALKETDLSPRELAVRFTDTEGYFVSESSVYRLLKAHDLITSPAFIVVKAADEFKNKTTAPNQLWQTDFTRHSPDDIQIRGNRTTGPPPRERHLLLQPSDGLILVSGLRLEGHSVIFLAIQTHLSCRFLLTVDFLGPTPERVLAADHRSAVGFSETGRGSPPPPPIGT